MAGPGDLLLVPGGWFVVDRPLRLPNGDAALIGLLATDAALRGGGELLLEPDDFTERARSLPDMIAAWHANRVILTREAADSLACAGVLNETGLERLRVYRADVPHVRSFTREDHDLVRLAWRLSAWVWRLLDEPVERIDRSCARLLPAEVLARLRAAGPDERSVERMRAPLGWGRELEMIEHLLDCAPHRRLYRLVGQR